MPTLDSIVDNPESEFPRVMAFQHRVEVIERQILNDFVRTERPKFGPLFELLLLIKNNFSGTLLSSVGHFLSFRNEVKLCAHTSSQEATTDPAFKRPLSCKSSCSEKPEKSIKFVFSESSLQFQNSQAHPNMMQPLPENLDDATVEKLYQKMMSETLLPSELACIKNPLVLMNFSARITAEIQHDIKQTAPEVSKLLDASFVGQEKNYWPAFDALDRIQRNLSSFKALSENQKEVQPKGSGNEEAQEVCALVLQNVRYRLKEFAEKTGLWKALKNQTEQLQSCKGTDTNDIELLESPKGTRSDLLENNLLNLVERMRYLNELWAKWMCKFGTQEKKIEIPENNNISESQWMEIEQLFVARDLAIRNLKKKTDLLTESNEQLQAQLEENEAQNSFATEQIDRLLGAVLQLLEVLATERKQMSSGKPFTAGPPDGLEEHLNGLVDSVQKLATINRAQFEAKVLTLFNMNSCRSRFSTFRPSQLHSSESRKSIMRQSGIYRGRSTLKKNQIDFRSKDFKSIADSFSEERASISIKRSSRKTKLDESVAKQKREFEPSSSNRDSDSVIKKKSTGLALSDFVIFRRNVSRRFLPKRNCAVQVRFVPIRREFFFAILAIKSRCPSSTASVFPCEPLHSFLQPNMNQKAIQLQQQDSSNSQNKLKILKEPQISFSQSDLSNPKLLKVEKRKQSKWGNAMQDPNNVVFQVNSLAQNQKQKTQRNIRSITVNYSLAQMAGPAVLKIEISRALFQLEREQNPFAMFKRAKTNRFRNNVAVSNNTQFRWVGKTDSDHHKRQVYCVGIVFGFNKNDFFAFSSGVSPSVLAPITSQSPEDANFHPQLQKLISAFRKMVLGPTEEVSGSASDQKTSANHLEKHLKAPKSSQIPHVSSEMAPSMSKFRAAERTKDTLYSFFASQPTSPKILTGRRESKNPGGETRMRGEMVRALMANATDRPFQGPIPRAKHSINYKFFRISSELVQKSLDDTIRVSALNPAH